MFGTFLLGAVSTVMVSALSNSDVRWDCEYLSEGSDGVLSQIILTEGDGALTGIFDEYANKSVRIRIINNSDDELFAKTKISLQPGDPERNVIVEININKSNGKFKMSTTREKAYFVEKYSGKCTRSSVE